MSQERKIEITANLLVLIFTVLLNILAVVWFLAEMRSEVTHIHKQVNDNSDKIEKLSEILLNQNNKEVQ